MVPLMTVALATETDWHAEARVTGSLYPSFAVDEEGSDSGQGGVVDTRVRLGADVNFNDRDAFHLEGDVLDSQVLGNPWTLGGTDTRRRDVKGYGDASAYAPRRLSASTRMGPVALEAGLQTSHWGLGLLANDGAHGVAFGREDGGDTVLRLKAATMPIEGLPFYVVLTADRVYADELAVWLDGQAAYQGSLALLYRGDTTAGIYAVMRHQKEEDRQRSTTVGVVDLYAAVPLVTTDEAALTLSFEGAGIIGQTSRASSYNATDGLAVLSGGGLASLDLSRGPILASLRGGYATGDGDPYDEGTHDFAADPNLQVGMVLYDEVLGGIDARAYQQLDDDHNIGAPPDGAETIAAEGAWRRSTFAQPILGWQKGPLEARAGLLLAWSTTPVSQPFYSGRNGGNPTSHRNEDWSGSYHLGTELDWALGYTKQTEKASFQALAQGGYLLPGAGLGAEESLIMLHTLTLTAKR